jgi:hypothetical protein
MVVVQKPDPQGFLMTAGRIALIALIYSSQIFLGTQPLILAAQILSLMIAGATLITYAIAKRRWVFPPAFFAFFFLFLAYVSVSLIFGLASAQTPPPVMARFLLNFMTTFSVSILAYGFSRLGIMSAERILKQILLATAIYSALKISIVAAFAIFDIPVVLLPLTFQAVFNTTPTFDVIAFGIIRFMAPTDFLAPFILYYCLVYMKGRLRIFLVALMATSIFVTFSRFIWLEGVFAVGVYLLTLSPGRILGVLMAAMIVMPIIAIWAPSSPIITRRFSSDAAFSDTIRVRQYDALTRDMDEHFLIGHGPASFSFSVIRDTGSPYSYEMQWVAFMYQLGVVGLVFLLGLAIFNIAPLLETPSLAAIPALLLYSFFLLSGFANPSLTGRSAGISFAFVLCLSILIRDQAKLLAIRSSASPDANLAPR